MSTPALATLLSTFFLRYLAVERGVSPHTTASYRDSIKLLLQFAATRCGRSIDQLAIEDLTGSLVLDFLSNLETSQHWLLCAVLFWPYPPRRRSAPFWAT